MIISCAGSRIIYSILSASFLVLSPSPASQPVGASAPEPSSRPPSPAVAGTAFPSRHRKTGLAGWLFGPRPATATRRRLTLARDARESTDLPILAILPLVAANSQIRSGSSKVDGPRSTLDLDSALQWPSSRLLLSSASLSWAKFSHFIRVGQPVEYKF